MHGHSKEFRRAMFCLIEFCLQRNNGDLRHRGSHLREV